jgi:hypothetical protein
MTFWQSIYKLLVDHPGWVFAIWTAFVIQIQFLWGVFAQSLRTPTAQDSQAYVSFFQISNAIAANTHRAQIPRVEDSPNFEAAVEKYLQSRANATSTIAAVNKIQTDQNLPGGK